MIFRKWGGIKGRLELFQKFIRFGIAALPLHITPYVILHYKRLTNLASTVWGQVEWVILLSGWKVFVTAFRKNITPHVQIGAFATQKSNIGVFWFFISATLTGLSVKISFTLLGIQDFIYKVCEDILLKIKNRKNAIMFMFMTWCEWSI